MSTVLKGDGSPPHTRGTLSAISSGMGRARITPAYTGNTCVYISSPHIQLGSPPHTRGTPLQYLKEELPTRITPAYTGNTVALQSLTSRNKDHPRIHGEHKSITEFSTFHQGSPPHTRGTLLDPHIRKSTAKDHPRIHGEHSKSWHRQHGTQGSPPHTRGTLQTPYRHHTGLGSPPHTRGTQISTIQTDVNGRITPAYTGNSVRLKSLIYKP